MNQRKPYFLGVNIPLIRILLEATRHLTGDVIEFGIGHGGTFSVIYEACKHSCFVYAVDCFTGVPESGIDGENDRFAAGSHAYPGGFQQFHADYPDASICKGLMENIVDKDVLPLSIRFAHIDFDLYEPTAHAIIYTWGHLVDGGIMIVHDYYHHDLTCASRAVREFMEVNGVDYIGVVDNSIFFQKGAML